MQATKESLIKALDAGSGVQYVLDTADALIGLPIIFIDLKYCLLARSKSNAERDPLWKELTTTGHFSHTTVHFFKEAKFIESYNTSHVALMQFSTLADRLNGIVFDADGLQLGSICAIAYNRPLTEMDYQFIQIICDKLTVEAHEYVEKRQAERSLDAMIVDLIEGCDCEGKWEKQIAELQKTLHNKIYVAVVDTIHYDNTNTHLVYFASLFKQLENTFHYFICLNNIVVLFSAENVILNIEETMKKLNAFFKKYDIYAGVSSDMNNLCQLKHYFKEALNALNYGLCTDSDRNIFSYDSFRSELFLNDNIDNFEARKICHPIFFAMRSYDQQNKTTYVETLNTYFISGMDIQCVIKKLNITAKEFSNFLKELKHLFRIDFNDGNMLYSIFRSIKLYKCFPEQF